MKVNSSEKVFLAGVRKVSSIAVMAVGLALALGLGCSGASDKLLPQPDPEPPKKVTAIGTTVTFNPKVDILFVIDDSGSMEEHQDNLADNIELFTQGIVGLQLLDYQIGVITTSVEGYDDSPGVNGVLVGKTPIVTRTTPKGIDVLKKNLRVGTGGSATEKMFDPVQLALTPPANPNPQNPSAWEVQNTGFYRRDAFLVVIFITDAEDQSRALKPESLYRFLLGLKSQDREKVITYGVYIPTTDRTCPRSGETPPYTLEAFFRLAGTKTLGLCDDDYGSQLASLGDDLVKKVGRTLYLPRPPILATITVTFGTQIIPNDVRKGWTYNPEVNAIVFGQEIEWDKSQGQAELKVDYLAAEIPSDPVDTSH